IGRFYETVIDDLAALPGVERVAAASGFLGGTLSGASPFTIEGRAVDKNDIEAAFIASVSPGYFSTAGIPLLQGRDFDSGDDEDGARVVIVNRTMAEKYWPGVSPVGRRMAYGTNPDTETEWMTVVGVVGDVRQLGPDRGIRPKTFLPLRQNPTRFMTVLFRSPLSPESLFPAMREAIWQRDDRIPVAGVETVASILDERLAGRRHNTFVLGLFAGAAVFLAAIGVYGVLAYSVSQRSQELGVRMAFGARAWDVAMLVWKDGAALLAIGLVIGGLGLFPLKRLLAGLLFGVGPFDPLALMASSVLLALCAFVACAVPALRAATTDPVRALRE
ncbi:MAG TPA: ABC transporter permease, partial [Vicinamibacteria bacterium]|nr:ABC transporter permease [Vicinamibacteria bacterium]